MVSVVCPWSKSVCASRSLQIVDRLRRLQCTTGISTRPNSFYFVCGRPHCTGWEQWTDTVFVRWRHADLRRMFTYLGVFVDSDLSMRTHVQRTVSRCFAILRQLRSIRRSVPIAVFQSLVVCLILSRLDYCNSVLVGLPANLTNRLQSVQNAAARLVYGLRRYDHVTGALASLHWLRVAERIQFKIAVLTYRALHDSAPRYLSDFVRVADVPGRQRLRSASTNSVIVSPSRLSTIGDRRFPVAGAKIWNSLPSDVTSAPSLLTFRRRLKTFLFRQSFPNFSIWLQ